MGYQVIKDEKVDHQPDMVAGVLTGGLSLVADLLTDHKDHQVTVLNTETGKVASGTGCSSESATRSAIGRAK